MIKFYDIDTFMICQIIIYQRISNTFSFSHGFPLVTVPAVGDYKLGVVILMFGFPSKQNHSEDDLFSGELKLGIATRHLGRFGYYAIHEIIAWFQKVTVWLRSN